MGITVQIVLGLALLAYVISSCIVRRNPATPISGVIAARHCHVPEWLTSTGIAAFLLALALAVRWWGLPAQAHQMDGDEARFMFDARRFIQGVYTSPFIVDWQALPGLYDFMLSFPLRIAGATNVTVARGFTGALAAIGAPLLYFTARELGYPRRVGIVAGIVMATTFWGVIFSRMVLPNVVPATATTATVLLLVMAVRRSNLLLAAAAGLALAWVFNAHVSGPMDLPVVFGWLALLVLRHGDLHRWFTLRSRRRVVRTPGNLDFPMTSGPEVARSTGTACPDLDSADVRLKTSSVLAVTAVFLITALICLVPLIKLYLEPGSVLAAHSTKHFILNAENRAAFAALHPDIGTSIPGLLQYQFSVTIGMFSAQGDPDPLFNVPGRPLLDVVSSILLFAGLAGCVWRLRMLQRLARAALVRRADSLRRHAFRGESGCRHRAQLHQSTPRASGPLPADRIGIGVCLAGCARGAPESESAHACTCLAGRATLFDHSLADLPHRRRRAAALLELRRLSSAPVDLSDGRSRVVGIHRSSRRRAGDRDRSIFLAGRIHGSFCASRAHLHRTMVECLGCVLTCSDGHLRHG